ncbi:phage head closure protein [Fructilactobacillus fructivorans]|nr:phage head closure protein [Fructilactobacillus fructivorans]KRK58500.1 Phage head-tail joining protein [Fructilactobacillus fructivorans]KRN13344.1 Phage head-tail joining protein [Fructilactobacillus fructivorans]KRN40054.1 Phage head-tail joining protein [Fructilactobacillus fructivorans]
MAKKLLYSSFNKKITVGVPKTVTNENNGNTYESFESKFQLWACPYRRSMPTRYNLLGTEWQDTITLIVKHDERITGNLLIKYGDTLYKLVDYSPDEGNGFMNYDYLTLEAKNGG